LVQKERLHYLGIREKTKAGEREQEERHPQSGEEIVF
jgi:hypothetical protein